ncbi:FAD-dependent oxidoreductase [Adhaeribacter aquaticus]|uniref:FAD-dependent oxidoreductase n=1 Tax=Adhaeribacter aquaticus TaxID=299567 RepID=UPI0004120AF6|nr:NAD(P)/FAD-dependent oxidoreductase [Adhaeribacter aquaticus]
MINKENVTVMGGGLVGCLLSLYLAKKGYHVDVYERKPDLRKAYKEYGRSINLALSDRGWKALNGIGIGDDIRKVAIPMYGRMMHDIQGNLSFLPYGKGGQAIYSVSRGGLNIALLDLVEAEPNVNLHFSQQCQRVDLQTNKVYLKNSGTGEESIIKPDRLFGVDGAYSMVRYSMQKTERFDYSQSYLNYGYKELTIAAGPFGKWVLEKEALHIWPRGNYMMIALPNLNGTFTCTLFFPYDGEESFSALKTEADVLAFFNKQFPDAVPLMPDLAKEYFANPVGDLVTIKCSPWAFSDKVLLLGDASHGIVPFYGQGMNAGFEDCTIFNELLEQHTGDWHTIFDTFQKLRKPNTDAMADLAIYNFIEMRDKVADPRFLLQKKIESKINALYPEHWIPLYTMVTFSDIPYAEAKAAGERQEKIMAQLMPHIQTEADFDKPEVQLMIKKYVLEDSSDRSS